MNKLRNGGSDWMTYITVLGGALGLLPRKALALKVLHYRSEGRARIVVAISYIALASPLRESVEHVVNLFVLPVFTSRPGGLRHDSKGSAELNKYTSERSSTESNAFTM